jgi:glycosyltransferase involved in cell wall biosynthesis
MRVLHVVVTRNFAGTERYVCQVAGETARRGWDVTVVGGDPGRMRAELGASVRWLPGATLLQAGRSVLRAGRQDVCHTHMTMAETVGVGLRGVHRGRLVSTRHFAAARGASRVGARLAPWIQRHLDCEIAISNFVASKLEKPPTAVIYNGVADSPLLWRPESRTVLVMQRLEPEKDTVTAIEGWRLSGLADEGWTLRIVGDGTCRRQLEQQVGSTAGRRVTFAGWCGDTQAELASAAVLIAPAPAEPFGLSVMEALAAGIPVLAAAGGAHPETVGKHGAGLMFAPGDPEALAQALRRMAAEPECLAQWSGIGRETQRRVFSLSDHVHQLSECYNASKSPLAVA